MPKSPNHVVTLTFMNCKLSKWHKIKKYFLVILSHGLTGIWPLHGLWSAEFPSCSRWAKYSNPLSYIVSSTSNIKHPPFHFWHSRSFPFDTFSTPWILKGNLLLYFFSRLPKHRWYSHRAKGGFIRFSMFIMILSYLLVLKCFILRVSHLIQDKQQSLLSRQVHRYSLVSYINYWKQK